MRVADEEAFRQSGVSVSYLIVEERCVLGQMKARVIEHA